MEKSKQAIILLSGGIDSTTLLAQLTHLNYTLTALSFFYGQRHQIELDYAQRNAAFYQVANHSIIELDKNIFQNSALINNNTSIEKHIIEHIPTGYTNTYVPFRNLVFISYALSLAETLQIREIFIAVNKDDCNNYWDCASAFFGGMQAIVRQSETAIQIQTPFINLTKSEIIKLAHKLNVDLTQTVTCYQPDHVGTECGECLSCRIKQKALNNLFH